MGLTCTLTGTIYRDDGAVATGAVVSFTLCAPRNTHWTSNNRVVLRAVLSATTDGSGNFSQVVARNDELTPAGTYWKVECADAALLKHIAANADTLNVIDAPDLDASAQVFSGLDDPDADWVAHGHAQTLTAAEKLQAATNLGLNLSASQLLGQASSGGTGLPVAVTLGTGLAMSGTTLNVTLSTGLTVGTTAIASGTSGRILYDNAGVLGELPVGTGVATALAVNVGSAGAFITQSGGTAGNAASATLAATVTVANEATDTTCFPMFATAATGSLAAMSNAGLTFNSATGLLSATGLAGAFNGTVGATTPSTIAGTTGTFSGVLSTTGEFANIVATGANSYIATTGEGSTITTTGNLGTISTIGTNAPIYTSGTGSYIQSRDTFRLTNGTHITTLSHAPTANRAIALPNAAGTLALTSDITGGTLAGSFTTLTVNDNSTLGSSNADTVNFNARVASDINPATDNTYDLGVTGNEWRNLNIDGTANIDSLVADTADINGGTIDATAIGAATPSTVAGTTITGTSSLTLGTNGGTGGSIVLNGSTSGSSTLSVSATGVLALPSFTVGSITVGGGIVSADKIIAQNPSVATLGIDINPYNSATQVTAGHPWMRLGGGSSESLMINAGLTGGYVDICTDLGSGLRVWDGTGGHVTYLTTPATGTLRVTTNGSTLGTVDAASLTLSATTSLLLGTAGSAVGNIGFRNATSGTTTLQPATGALGTGTVTLPLSGTLATLEGANTFTAENINSKSGAASVTAMKFTGVPFAGTGTTSFPLVYINDANATASTGLNTAGTYFGVNGDGTQDLMNLMNDGVSKCKVTSTGSVQVSEIKFGTKIIGAGGTGEMYGTDGSTYWRYGGSVGGAFWGAIALGSTTAVYGANASRITGIVLKDTAVTEWNSDTTLSRSSAGVLQLGTGTTANALGSLLLTNLTASGTLAVTGATTLTGLLTANGGITLGNGQNIAFNTTTGTKIGAATTQKLSFWNATPIVQPTTAVASATVAHTGGGTNIKTDDTFDGYTLAQVVKALRNAGLLA